MYRIVLACKGVPTHAGAAGARDISNEFAQKPWHANVTCVWDGSQLILQAEKDFDSNGLARELKERKKEREEQKHPYRKEKRKNRKTHLSHTGLLMEGLTQWLGASASKLAVGLYSANAKRKRFTCLIRLG
jgi:hypothetical protein